MLALIRLLDTAKRQKLRSNSGLSQRELLDSGIDIMESNGELYSDSKEQASRRSIEAQLYAAGLSPCPPPPPPPHPFPCGVRGPRLTHLCPHLGGLTKGLYYWMNKVANAVFDSFYDVDWYIVDDTC